MNTHSGIGLGTFIALLAGVWVMIDATRRGKDGFSAFLWGLGSFLILCVFLPLWLMLRPPTLESGEGWRDRSRSTDAFYCPNCRQQTDREAAYCEHCGKATWDKMR
jgi:hypothetical protein